MKSVIKAAVKEIKRINGKMCRKPELKLARYGVMAGPAGPIHTVFEVFIADPAGGPLWSYCPITRVARIIRGVEEI